MQGSKDKHPRERKTESKGSEVKTKSVCWGTKATAWEQGQE